MIVQCLFHNNINLILEHFTSGCHCPSAMIIHFFQVNPSMIYQVDLLYGFFFLFQLHSICFILILIWSLNILLQVVTAPLPSNSTLSTSSMLQNPMAEPTVVNITNTTEVNLAQSSENSSSATPLAVTLSKDNPNLQWTLIIIIKQVTCICKCMETVYNFMANL